MCSGQANYTLCPIVGESGMSWNDDECMRNRGASACYGGLDVKNGPDLMWVRRNVPCDCFNRFAFPVVSKVTLEVGPRIFFSVFMV